MLTHFRLLIEIGLDLATEAKELNLEHLILLPQ